MLTKNILVVDDEPKTRNGVQKILENWSQGKYSIYTAANSEEAIAIMEKNKIHILLSDIRMPEITGLQLLTIIKEKKWSPVVVFISAYSEFTYAHEALRLGVINYLLKPISKKDLIEAVEEAVITLEKKERAGIIEKVVDEKIIDANTKIDSTSETIRAAIAYIDQHLKDEINQKDVAAYVHLNPSYLSVLFKEQVNVTFSEYVTRRRIQRAKELLISTTLPISEIAEEVGYKTAKYFIKMFKEMEGITPSAYRKINHERAF
jgi:two-component system, response regulator YesN